MLSLFAFLSRLIRHSVTMHQENPTSIRITTYKPMRYVWYIYGTLWYEKLAPKTFGNWSTFNELMI